MKIINTIHNTIDILDCILLNSIDNKFSFSEISKNDILSIEKNLSKSIGQTISNITGLIVCSLHDFGTEFKYDLINHWLDDIRDLRNSCYNIIKKIPIKEKKGFTDEELIKHLIIRINSLFGEEGSYKQSFIDKIWSNFKLREINNNYRPNKNYNKFAENIKNFKIKDSNEQVYVIRLSSEILEALFTNDIDRLHFLLEAITGLKIDRSRLIKDFKYKG